MGTIFGAVISILLLIVVVWVSIFGGIGALFARSRGGSAPMGLAWGTALGPIGWLVIAWVTRSATSTSDYEPNPQPGPPPQVARESSESEAGAAGGRWDPWNT